MEIFCLFVEAAARVEFGRFVCYTCNKYRKIEGTAMEQTKKRILSGIQPTGTFTLGNYVGAVRNWDALQDDYECVYLSLIHICIALGSLLGKAGELYQEGRAGILTPVMDVLTAVFRTIGSWGLGGILAVWLAAVVLVLLICYLVLRKAAVKGI